VGRHVVNYALEKGCKVKVLVRNEKKFKDILKEKASEVEVTVGDATNQENVNDFVSSDVNFVFCCVGMSGKIPVVTDTARCLANALKPTQRLCTISSIGVGDSDDQMKNMSWCFYYCIRPCCFSKAFADLEKAEPVYAGMKNVILARPCGLNDKPGTGKFLLTTADNYDIPTTDIARADVAWAMVSFLDDRTWDGKAVSIVNAK